MHSDTCLLLPLSTEGQPDSSRPRGARAQKLFIDALCQGIKPILAVC